MSVSMEKPPMPATVPPLQDPQSEAADHSHYNAIGDLGPQYLETLYLSRAPLAYFVKGPLSRARVEHQSTDAVTSEGLSLPEALRSHILPFKEKGSVAKIDKKYATAIPELIRQIPPGATAEDDGSYLKAALGGKIRKSKKRKRINPDGFLPNEEDSVVRWWIARETADPEGDAHETQEKRIKSACLNQKPREMQLQIILILEILALEQQVYSNGQALRSDIYEDLEITSRASSKKNNKPTDLSKALDILLEKLQIWETTNQGLLDIGTEINSASSKSKRKNHTSNSSDDSLRNFCTEVIIP
ncbi:MAG: hypothetical protein LQ340_002279, partial [Diploschistes diacapsis]